MKSQCKKRITKQYTMTTLSDKVAQLKSFLSLFGVSNLTDYDTRIFSRDLKKNSEFLGKVKSMEEGLGKTFDISVDVSSVEQAIKLLKKLLVECDLNFETGRTSETSYMKLAPKDEDTETQRLVGNYVFNCPTNGKESLGEHLRKTSDLKYIPDYKYLPFPTLVDEKDNVYEVEVGKPDRICFLVQTNKKLTMCPFGIMNMDFECVMTKYITDDLYMYNIKNIDPKACIPTFMRFKVYPEGVTSITMMEQCALESKDMFKEEVTRNNHTEHLDPDEVENGDSFDYNIHLDLYKNEILRGIIFHTKEIPEITLWSEGKAYVFETDIIRSFSCSTIDIDFSFGKNIGLPLNKVEKITCRYTDKHDLSCTLRLTSLQTPVQIVADKIKNSPNFSGNSSSPFLISVFTKFPQTPPGDIMYIKKGVDKMKDVNIIIYSVPNRDESGCVCDIRDDYLPYMNTDDRVCIRSDKMLDENLLNSFDMVVDGGVALVKHLYPNNNVNTFIVEKKEQIGASVVTGTLSVGHFGSCTVDSPVVVEKPDKKVSFVLFYSNECKCCKEVLPIFKQLSRKISGCDFITLNISNHPDVVYASQKTMTKIDSVPYLVLYVQGLPVARYFGSNRSKHIEKFIVEILKQVQTEKFIDDLKENIERVRKNGTNEYVYTNVSQIPRENGFIPLNKLVELVDKPDTDGGVGHV